MATIWRSVCRGAPLICIVLNSRNEADVAVKRVQQVRGPFKVNHFDDGLREKQDGVGSTVGEKKVGPSDHQLMLFSLQHRTTSTPFFSQINQLNSYHIMMHLYMPCVYQVVSFTLTVRKLYVVLREVKNQLVRK